MGRPAEGNELIPGQGGGYKSTQHGGPLRQLKPHHHSMARMVAVGLPPGEIAALTGFSPGQISKIQGSPLFQAAVARLSEGIEEAAVASVQEELRGLAPRAVEVLDEDLNFMPTCTQDRKVRQAAAIDILNRTGYKIPERVEHAHAHILKDARDMPTEQLATDILDVINAD